MSQPAETRLPKLVLAKDLSLLGASTKALSEASRAGALTRIRQGIYVSTSEWRQLQPWQQYRLRVEAAAEALSKPTVFSRHSAGAVWGIPTILRGQPVHAITTFRGGGRSRAGVKRHLVEGGRLDFVERDGLLVTGRVVTVLDLAAYVPFAEAIVPLDHVIKPDLMCHLPALTKAQLLEALEGRYPPTVERRVRAAIEFADPLSASAGESYSRGLIHAAGLARPVLQYRIPDVAGSAVFADFYWEETRTVGEFDGIQKYQKPEYSNGRMPSQVVVDEKLREDRIRATGRGVVRWVWADLNNPGELERKLRKAGVPGRRRASAGPRT
ncbi:hypothetical protein [Arthrobacter sp. ISL-30]|uniref:hypothetical protein n=1 Tax=Arthrobacter sp. ISL-30 TaxID=2819109 RepID=UPI001BE5F56A|nr:hypothetical protein [Arthrobacter sp. ISL-30]MBT2513267.1 hypothetical protein [Arthrobacter sp. ISL-30]